MACTLSLRQVYDAVPRDNCVGSRQTDTQSSGNLSESDVAREQEREVGERFVSPSIQVHQSESLGSYSGAERHRESRVWL